MLGGVRIFSEGGVRVELAVPVREGTITTRAGAAPSPSPSLTIDVEEETTERRIERLITENPVIIFSRKSCCMCHVMKKLLSKIDVYPAVIELEEAELGVLAAHDDIQDQVQTQGRVAAPAPGTWHRHRHRHRRCSSEGRGLEGWKV
ncbi:hypothetical protein NE237_030078 [Protea cynaroides]|uniref:Glutaredoxin domain-containing protein n=1 Tax=Protea cynaroides TaxID=273540 RepID=A0A9Q0GUE0_9MAGN|nr:hypothetical protein NE237_030078 [Protea cynaroides]